MTFNNKMSMFGLALDIIGVLLIYFNGLSPKIRNGTEMTEEEVNSWRLTQMPKDEAKKVERNNWWTKFWSYTGLALVILGFLAQFFAPLVTDNKSNKHNTRHNCKHHEH